MMMQWEVKPFKIQQPLPTAKPLFLVLIFIATLNMSWHTCMGVRSTQHVQNDVTSVWHCSATMTEAFDKSRAFSALHNSLAYLQQSQSYVLLDFHTANQSTNPWSPKYNQPPNTETRKCLSCEEDGFKWSLAFREGKSWVPSWMQ